MNQVPNIPQPQMVPQQCPAQPNYNAVKIDIINPSVAAPGAQYAQPTAPYYNYPQAPIYNYPQAQTYPQYPACQPQPAPQVPECPAGCQPAAPAQQPVVINQQNNNAPVEQKNPQQPAAEVPQPQVSQPEVVAPEQTKPQIDLNGYVSRLGSPDFQGQLNAMEDIADLVKDTPDKATELVDTKIFDALNNIINIDSSKLEGPSQAQLDARQKMTQNQQVSEEEANIAKTLAPRELADRNKSYALFTVAILDKLFADEVAKLPGSTLPPLTELPAAITLVDQLKDNPNPMVRSSAIEALSYLQTPEYKKDLTTLFTVAKNDADPGVAQYADAALAKLNQI